MMYACADFRSYTRFERKTMSNHTRSMLIILRMHELFTTRRDLTTPPPFRWLMLACIASLIVACNVRFPMILSDCWLLSSLSCVSREALLLASCMGSFRIDNKSLRPFEYSSHELGSRPTTTIRLRNGSPCTVALGKPATLSPS